MENRDALLLRLPIGLKERLEEVAREHRRSANRETQVAIEAHLMRERVPQIEKR